MRVRPLLAVAAAAALLGATAACGPSPSAGGTGRGVLVVAIDGLRADHLSSMGYERPTTPTLDALAAEGVTLANTISASPLLLPAHVPLVTGCDPNVARRRFRRDDFALSVEERWRIPDGVPCLPAEFLERGFRTAAFVDHPYLAASSGFARGFQRYLAIEPRRTRMRETSGAAVQVPAFLQWLRSLDRSTPWLAYLHLHDLERTWRYPDPLFETYFQPDPEDDAIPPVGQTDSVFFALPRSRWRGGARTVGDYVARYDGHLRRLDAELGELLQTLALLERDENTTVVVIGTHGVQFGEGGLYLRSGLFSPADLHVPWLVRSPRVGPELRGTRIEHVASTLDLAPTLLDLHGMPVPGGMHGVSFAPALRGEDDAPPREHAFATCGLLDGGAVYAERHVLELLRPAQARDAALRRSWFGVDDVPERAERLLFYDRFVSPFPPASSRLTTLPPAAHPLHQAGAIWDFRVEQTRRVLQGGTLFFDPATPEEIAELRAEGFLGDAH